MQDVHSAVSANMNATKVARSFRDCSAIHAMHALQRTHCVYGMRDQNASQRVRHVQ